MPTYDFRCPQGHVFERFFSKISDGLSEVPCPECGEVAIRQLSGGAGLHFKGSGFYLTDYGKNAHRSTGGASKPSADKGESSSGGESKGSDAKASEAKPSEAKPAESKSSDAKPSPSKPAKPSGAGEG